MSFELDKVRLKGILNKVGVRWSDFAMSFAWGRLGLPVKVMVAAALAKSKAQVERLILVTGALES